MLNLLDPEEYPSAEDFAERFGAAGAPSVEQIKALQARAGGSRAGWSGPGCVA